MIILTPIYTGQEISLRVAAGICTQSIPCAWYPVDTPCNPPSRIGANTSRLKMIEISKKFTGPYIVNMDSDVALTSPTAIEDLKNHLEKNPRLGGCALWFEKYVKKDVNMPHVDIKCCCIRTELFQTITFKDMNRCGCIDYKLSLKKAGYDFEYIDFVNRAQNLRDTHLL